MTHTELRNPSFYKKTIYLMVPVMLQQLITVGINFLDNIMIGGFGETPIAAVSLANQFYSIFQFVCMGLGSGAIVMSAQFWGGRKLEPLKVVAAIALRLTAAISAVFLLASVLWPQVILKIYTNDTAVIEAGTTYTRLIGTTFLFAGISSTVTYLLRSTGHVKIPLISSIGAFVLNLFFNWVFIFGKLGFPCLGVVGAAVGTVIARTFEFLLIFGYFVIKDRNFSFRLSCFSLSGRELLPQYIKFSLPVLFSDTMLGIGLSLGSVIIGHISAEFVAANAIVNNGVHLLTIANTSLAGASGVVIGNTIGDGDTDKAYREGVSYIILSILLGLLFSVIIWLLKNPYLSIYTVSQETWETAQSLCWYVILVSPFQMLSYVTSKGVLRGGGDTRFLMVADIILLWAVSLPLGALAGLVWHMSPFWVNFFIKFEYSTKGLMCTARFLTKKWIKVVDEK